MAETLVLTGIDRQSRLPVQQCHRNDTRYPHLEERREAAMIEEAKVEAVMIGVATEAGDRVKTSRGVAAPALRPCCYARFSAPSVAVLAGFNHVLSFPQNRLTELRPVVRELDQRSREAWLTGFRVPCR